MRHNKFNSISYHGTDMNFEAETMMSQFRFVDNNKQAQLFKANDVVS